MHPHCKLASIASADCSRARIRSSATFRDTNQKGSAQGRGNKRELQQKCDELLKEIEERKRLHGKLRSKLLALGETVDKNEEPFQLGTEISCDLDSIVAKNGVSSTEKETLNIVMVGAECEPYSKTGGLADVMGALPKSLSEIGHRVMVVVPRYAQYEDATFTGIRMQYTLFGSSQEVSYYHEYRSGVDFVFVDHPSYHNRGNAIYGGDRLDVAFRCALLCKAALEAPWHVPCGGITYGDSNLVYIANDWHSALIPVYLQAHYQDHGKLIYARSVFVIHNMAFQGRGSLSELPLFEIPSPYQASFALHDPVGGEHMNLMKAAFLHSHRIVAVSHGYASECQTEEGGWGLDVTLREQSWKLSGIVNGIDQEIWNPQLDPHLQMDGYINYSLDTLDDKAHCKAALQREMGLNVDPKVPIIGFIGRLDYQKGVDLIQDSISWLMEQDIQLIMLGSGRPDYEAALREMENSHRDQCRCWVGFSTTMAHKITAACDLLLMPSRYEPCGLNQLYAMAYGTVPIVHAVGGLRDTVLPFDPYKDHGTGFTFDWMDVQCLKEAVDNALRTYREFPDSFRLLQQRGMRQRLGWDHAAQRYSDVLIEAKYQW